MTEVDSGYTPKKNFAIAPSSVLGAGEYGVLMASNEENCMIAPSVQRVKPYAIRCERVSDFFIQRGTTEYLLPISLTCVQGVDVLTIAFILFM